MNDNPTQDEKLREAQRRYGRPFKCGPSGLPREVWRHDKRSFVVVDEELPITPSKLAYMKRVKG
jgi:hypothetical protein